MHSDFFTRAPIRTPSWFAAAFACALLPMAFSPAATAQKALSLQKAPQKTGKMSSQRKLKTMEKAASSAVDAYYKALIKGDYRKAGVFVHDDLIQGLRRETTALIEKEKNEKRKAVILKELGATSLAGLQNTSGAVFFARWANSTLGYRIAVMANPKAEAKADVENVYCYPKENYCDVAVQLRARNQGDKVTTNRVLVRCAPEGRQWKVGQAPKKVRRRVPVNPVGQ